MAPKTVVLAEDELTVRSVIRQFLETEGYEVLEAGDGDEALLLSNVCLRPIHLLLTDLDMPRMNGLELAQRLRAQQPNLKVLYVSGAEEDEAMQALCREQGSHFLRKPFLRAELEAKLREVMPMD